MVVRKPRSCFSFSFNFNNFKPAIKWDIVNLLDVQNVSDQKTSSHAELLSNADCPLWSLDSIFFFLFLRKCRLVERRLLITWYSRPHFYLLIFT